MEKLPENATGSDWDAGNSFKNWHRHVVARGECEQVFFNEPVVVSGDTKQFNMEKRWFLPGIIESGRFLLVVFVLKNKLIRVISARDMNIKERRIYNDKTSKS